MALFDQIVSLFPDYEKTNRPLSDFAHSNDFIMKELPPHKDDGDFYKCFHAEKLDSGKTIVITIETKDKYRSFGKDDEPYCNTVFEYDNGNLLRSKSYTYFE